MKKKTRISKNHQEYPKNTKNVEKQTKKSQNYRKIIKNVEKQR